MVHALCSLLPPIEVIKVSPLNVDPDTDFSINNFTRVDIAKGGTPLSDCETETTATPFVQVTLNEMEDRLIGSDDLEESANTCRTVFSPSSLAKAHRGTFHIDDVNLLDEETTNILLNAVFNG